MGEKTERKRNVIAVANLKCTSCGRWFVHSLDEFPRNCPYCNRPITTITCNRCGKTWKLRQRKYPCVCANLKCKSPYYNRKYLDEIREDMKKESNDEIQS